MTMLEAALQLAARGMSVFPCKPRDKIPATFNGLKAATTDPDVLRVWWGKDPNYNVAVATGKISGMFVVDVDGDIAEQELTKLQQQHGALPLTVESLTARGRHLVFRMPDGVTIRNSASKIGPKIDVRGDGGYILVAPSIHPSGAEYRWRMNGKHGFTAAPDWLIDLVTRREHTAIVEPMHKAKTWAQIFCTNAGEGQRNDRLSRVIGFLLREIDDAAIVRELALAWNATHCKPPLDEVEVRRTFKSIGDAEKVQILLRKGFSND